MWLARLVWTLAVTASLAESAAIPTELVSESNHTHGPKFQTEVGPVDVRVKTSTQDSITLQWKLSGDDVSQDIDDYRIHYKHGNLTDVKTIGSNKTQYQLSELHPFTMYEIWLEGVLRGNRRTPQSDHIKAHTDVDEPGAPAITNLTCYDTGSIYVQWTRPIKYHKSVDYYQIFYRIGSESVFEKISVQATPNSDTETFVIKHLQGNKDYVVKICAETQSLSNPKQTWIGDASLEVTVFLPAENCQGSRSSLISDSGVSGGELSAGMIGGAVCAVLFLLLAVIGLVVWRRYFKSSYYVVEPPRPAPPSSGIPNWEGEPGPDGQKGAIAVDDFEDHVARNHVDSDAGFSKEYNEIQKYCAKSVKATHEHSSHPDNKCKNRYLNIVAYDHTRVRLNPVNGQKKTADYINANYIDGFQKCSAYIGTQGPLEDTRESFWRMVWEQNVYVIVMITNLMERGRRKCDIYWPKDENTEFYGQIAAQLEKEEVMADYTVRTIKIKHVKLKKRKGIGSERTVKQFHYTSWPDHGVPCHTLPVLTFVRKSAGANPLPIQNPDPNGGGDVGGGGPIIVHCSAGVGRTGTYITIDTMLQQVVATNEFNVYGFLKHIRGQRNYLVQTEEQYVFIHDAVVEAMRSGNTEIEKEALHEYVEHLNDSVVIEYSGEDEDVDQEIELRPKPDTNIVAQFKLVTDFVPSEYQYLSTHKEINAAKNRNPDLVPVEAHRIPLAPKPGVEGSDYINASWLNGHNKLKEFIISQHPIEEIKEDFWRMLWDHNAQTVVLLSTFKEDEYPVFWPNKEAEMDCETFRVRFVEETVHEGHSTFDLVVSSQHDDYELAVRIIHCPEWHSLVNLVQAFSVLKVVQDWHLEYQDGPLVVVDRNGGTEAATFCALTTLCKQLESGNSLDVYQVAKLYHNKRPGIWSSPEDIMYLYKAMDTLIASKYANPLQEGQANNESATPVGGKESNGSALVGTICGGDSDVIERRHSASASSNLTADWCNASRRHSLPSVNGGTADVTDFSSLPVTVARMNGDAEPVQDSNEPAAANGGNGYAIAIDAEDLDEDFEDLSETAALTQKSRNLKELI